MLAGVLIDEETDEVDQVCLDIAMIFMAESQIDYAYEILGIGSKHNPKNIDLLFELAFVRTKKPASRSYSHVYADNRYRFIHQ